MEMDWHRILFSDHPLAFFLEILIRTPIMFLAVVIILRLTGKRGVQQLSIFEMVMIITLGSAAGDSMFYEDVGLLHCIAVFVIVLLIYRLMIYILSKSDKAEKFLEGEPVYLLKHGKLCLDSIDSDEMAAEEFFGELRSQNIEHLGQLRYVIIENTGKLSVFYYSNEDVKPGLPILPDEYCKKSKQIKHAGLYACMRCGNTQILPQADAVNCNRCQNSVWVQAIDSLRIT